MIAAIFITALFLGCGSKQNSSSSDNSNQNESVQPSVDNSHDKLNEQPSTNNSVQNTAPVNENTNTVSTTPKSDPTEAIKKNIRMNWTSYITIERTSYTYREAGGIYDLYLNLTNKTDYMLNSVKASINIVKTNGEVYKTENVYFTNVAAHSTVKEKVPDNNRGTSIDGLVIWSISSAELNFCYEPGNWAANSTDPYKCQ